jgi:hypothetical protein
LTLATNNYAGSELKGGIIAGADSLNGTNQYLSIASGLADWSTGFTYTGWAWWASNASASRLFDFGNGAASDNLWAGRNASTATTFSTEIYNNTTSGGIKSATSAIATGVWGHFAVTYNGQDLQERVPRLQYGLHPIPAEHHAYQQLPRALQRGGGLFHGKVRRARPRQRGPRFQLDQAGLPEPAPRFHLHLQSFSL